MCVSDVVCTVVLYLSTILCEARTSADSFVLLAWVDGGSRRISHRKGTRNEVNKKKKKKKSLGNVRDEAQVANFRPRRWLGYVCAEGEMGGQRQRCSKRMHTAVS